VSCSLMAYGGRNSIKATILVVDDSPEMQRYLRALLEVDSYRVETASNGHEALRSIRYGPTPQAVLLDMQMPGMDGLETLRRLQEFHPRPKVIMCSAVDDPLQVAAAASLGAHAYLLKPIRHLYLSAAIERCLNEVPARQPNQSLAVRPFLLPSLGPL
jgi:CheY-like chemotaxis protein